MQDIVQEIILPTKSEYFSICFDALTSTEPQYDYLTFYSQDPKVYNAKSCSYRYSGRNHNGFPGMGSSLPLIIKPESRSSASGQQSIWFQFHTDSSSNDWGYKFVVFPCPPPSDPLDEVIRTNAQAIVIETPHPLNDISANIGEFNLKVDSDVTTLSFSKTISFPGASAIAIAFDPRSETSLDSSTGEYLKSIIFYEDSLDEQINGDTVETLQRKKKYFYRNSCKLGGSQGYKNGLLPGNFPSIKNPFILPVSEVKMFYEEAFNSACGGLWGWRLIAYPINSYVTPFEVIAKSPFSVVIANKNDVVNNSTESKYSEIIAVTVPSNNGQYSMCKLAFDKRSWCKGNNPQFFVEILGQDPRDISPDAESSQELSLGLFKCSEGVNKSSFPGLDGNAPVVIPQLSFWIAVKQPDDITVMGSFTLAVAPCHDELRAWATEYGEILESSHFKIHTENILLSFDMEGVNMIEVAFDEQTSLNLVNEKIDFCDASLTSIPYANFTSNSISLPSMLKPLKLSPNARYLRYTSDSSGMSWGFRIALRPVFQKDKKYSKSQNKLEQLQKMSKEINSKLLIRERLCQACYFMSMTDDLKQDIRVIEPIREKNSFPPDYIFRGSVTFAGASKLKISFDERTNTEKDRDELHIYLKNSKLPSDYVIYFSDSERRMKSAIFSGPFRGSWDTMIIPTDRVFFTFNSLDGSNLWGFVMFASAEYPSLEVNGDVLQRMLIEDKSLFELCLCPVKIKASTYAGMQFACILGNVDMLQLAMNKMGTAWILDVIENVSDEVLILCLSALNRLINSTSANTTIVNKFMKNKLLAKLVELSLSPNIEVSYLLLQLLKKFTAVSESDVEAVLICCLSLNSTEVTTQVLLAIDLLIRLNGNISRRKIIFYNGLRYLRGLLESSVVEIQDLATKAICSLMQTEQSIMEFFNEENAEDSQDVIVRMIGSKNKNTIKNVLLILDCLSQQYSGDNLQSDALSLQKVLSFSHIIPRTLNVKSGMCPLWIPLQDPPIDSQSDKSHKKTISSSRNRAGGGSVSGGASVMGGTLQFSSAMSQTSVGTQNKGNSKEISAAFTASFWVLPETVLTGNGLPIFYKGMFNGTITATVESTVKTDILVKHGKVYFEVTYHTSGNETSVSTSQQRAIVQSVNSFIIFSGWMDI